MLNSAASLLLEFVSVICGFIVPRLIIGTYGSDINALTSSITQFLSYIALVEAGVGGVIRAALYRPLAEKKHRGNKQYYKRDRKLFQKNRLYLSRIYGCACGGISCACQ